MPAGELLLIEVRLPSDATLNLVTRVALSRFERGRYVVGRKLSSPRPGEKLVELRRLAAGAV